MIERVEGALLGAFRCGLCFDYFIRTWGIGARHDGVDVCMDCLGIISPGGADDTRARMAAAAKGATEEIKEILKRIQATPRPADGERRSLT